MAKICVAVPHANKMWTAVGAYLIFLERNKRGHKVDFEFPHSQGPIASTRNFMAKQFLESDYDFLLFMDSDNPPMASRGRNPLELAELDKDVVVLPTPIFHGGWKNPFLFNCYDVADDGDGYVEHHPQEGLQEVDVGGSGCMLIARRVLEALAPIPFRCGNDENGIQIYGEDFMFCEKAREKGFSIWSHFDYVCHHYKEVDLLDYHVSAHRQSEADSEVEATV